MKNLSAVFAGRAARNFASIVTALVRSGITADRLESSGNGPDKPVADNDSAEGRAKNRRVELVKL